MIFLDDVHTSLIERGNLRRPEYRVEFIPNVPIRSGRIHAVAIRRSGRDETVLDQAIHAGRQQTLIAAPDATITRIYDGIETYGHARCRDCGPLPAEHAKILYPAEARGTSERDSGKVPRRGVDGRCDRITAHQDNGATDRQRAGDFARSIWKMNNTAGRIDLSDSVSDRRCVVRRVVTNCTECLHVNPRITALEIAIKREGIDARSCSDSIRSQLRCRAVDRYRRAAGIIALGGIRRHVGEIGVGNRAAGDVRSGNSAGRDSTARERSGSRVSGGALTQERQSRRARRCVAVPDDADSATDRDRVIGRLPLRPCGQTKREQRESGNEMLYHNWNPHEFTSTAVAVPSAVVVMVMAVLIPLAGMHGVKFMIGMPPVPAALDAP